MQAVWQDDRDEQAAAFPLATWLNDNTWQHKAPCEASKTPLWTKGQRVTVERLFSGAELYELAPSEIRTVARVTSSRLTLDDGSTWQLDGRRPRDHIGDGRAAKVRPEVPGDAVMIERRALIRTIVGVRGDVWSEIPIGALRDIVKEIEAITKGDRG